MLHLARSLPVTPLAQALNTVASAVINKGNGESPKTITIDKIQK
jgi:hypothetical protein